MLIFMHIDQSLILEKRFKILEFPTKKYILNQKLRSTFLKTYLFYVFFSKFEYRHNMQRNTLHFIC